MVMAVGPGWRAAGVERVVCQDFDGAGLAAMAKAGIDDMKPDALAKG
jgi:hypothetical protein